LSAINLAKREEVTIDTAIIVSGWLRNKIEEIFKNIMNPDNTNHSDTLHNMITFTKIPTMYVSLSLPTIFSHSHSC
jgi:ABC-type long-subunit fatty acid transport system fused permease/ATPase subunit